MAIIKRFTSSRVYPSNKQGLINAVIITGLILVMLAVSYLSKRGVTFLEGTLAASIGVLAIVVFLTKFGKFEYGILAIALAGGLLNFFTLPTGRGSRIVISLIIAMGLTVLWLLQLFLSKGKTSIRSSPIKKPTLLFIAVGVFAYFWANLLRDPLVFVPSSFAIVQISALIVNSLLPFLALFVSSVVTETKWLKLYAWVMIALGAFVIISVIPGYLLSFLYNNGYRGMFATWVCAIALAMALFNEELSNKVRVLLVGLVAAWFYQDFVLHADWYSGWLPVIISIWAVLFFRSRKLFAVITAFVILIVVIDFPFFYKNVYVANYYGQGGNERWGLWQTNLNLVEKHPLFGVGPAGYAVYYMTYNPQNSRSTHNNYFDILSETGIVGFSIFLWLMGTYISIGIKTRRLLAGHRNFEEAFAVATLAGCLGILTGMMLGDWVIPFAYNQTISGFDNACFTWIFLGGMISLYLIIKKRTDAA